jgi:hypothetical protein
MEVAQVALLADPLQNLEAVFARHFQIQKQQAGHGIFFPVRIMSFARAPSRCLRITWR